jgi:hypothetical protein
VEQQRNPRVAHPNTRQPVKRATEWAWLCRRRRGLDRLTVGIPGVEQQRNPRLLSDTRFAG